MVNFSALGGINYVWNFGDGSAPQYMDVVSHSYTEYGVYNASVIITNGCGQVDTLNTLVTIDGSAFPSAEFWFDMYGDVYVGDVLNIVAERRRNSDSYQYQWSFDDGGYMEGPEVEYAFLTSGMHFVTLTVTNGCGTNSFTRDIWINEPVTPTCSAYFNYYIDPQTQQVQLMAQTTGNISNYSWNFGDNGTSSEINPVHVYSMPGYYNVCLYVFDQVSGCQASYCQAIQIVDTMPESCHSYFTYTVDGLSVHFNNKSTGSFDIVQWTFGDGSAINQNSPTHVYNYPGTYEVCLLVKSNSNADRKSVV